MIIMLLVIVSFTIKLTYHKPLGRVALCLAAAAVPALASDLAAGQSRTLIADRLSRPELMLDLSVWLTVDVALLICFCILMARRMTGAEQGRKESAALSLTLWFPGLLIFPVLFALLVETVFAMPGTDFGVIGYGMAAGVLVILPALACLLELLLPESDIRLELLFLVSLLTAALGIVATVNGRTAATGNNSVEWDALAGVVGILLVGFVAGMIINRYKQSKLK